MMTSSMAKLPGPPVPHPEVIFGYHQNTRKLVIGRTQLAHDLAKELKVDRTKNELSDL